MDDRIRRGTGRSSGRLATVDAVAGILWLLGVGLLLLGYGGLSSLALFGFAACTSAGLCGILGLIGLGVAAVGVAVAALGFLMGLGVMVSETCWIGSESWYLAPVIAAGYLASLAAAGVRYRDRG